MAGGTPDRAVITGARLAVHPVRAANAVFKPRGRFLDERALGVEVIDTWRNRIGTAIIVGVAVVYGGLRGLHDHLKGVIQALGVEFITLAGLSLLVGLGLLIYTRPGYRRRAAPYLALPFTVAASPLVPILAMEWVGGASERLMQNGRGFASVASLLLLIGEMYITLYAIIVLIRSLYLGVTGLCRAADAHPLFAPIMAPLFAVTLAIISLIEGTPSGPGPTGTAALALQWGGPFAQAAVSCLEIVALRRAAPDLFPFRHGPVAVSG